MINCKGKILDCNSSPKVMGILNVTPDSFFDGGQHFGSDDKIIRRLETLMSEGSDIIDIGAYSSRPGADDVPLEEEWARMERALKITMSRFPNAIVSVDTFRSEIARRSVDCGASIINDISAGSIDPLMFETVAELKVPYVLMHMQGTPQNMQDNPQYERSVCQTVIEELSAHAKRLTDLGVNDIIIDPGFGFGKTLEDNYELFANLNRFKVFNRPILVGISRKSMIYKLINKTPSESLNGTTVLNTAAILAGANILRVHDVAACVEAVNIATNILKYQ